MLDLHLFHLHYFFPLLQFYFILFPTLFHHLLFYFILCQRFCISIRQDLSQSFFQKLSRIYFFFYLSYWSFAFTKPSNCHIFCHVEKSFVLRFINISFWDTEIYLYRPIISSSNICSCHN